jgi:PAS domain S-box-containing protein
VASHADALVILVATLAFACAAAFVVRRKATDDAEELRVAAAAARAVLDNASDALIATGPDGVTVTEWNPAAERLFGWPARDIVGKPLPTVPGQDASLERDRIFERVRNGERPEITTRRRRADGSEILVRIAYSGLTDRRGRFSGWMGVVHDVTEERRQAERARLVERLAEVVGDLNGERDLRHLLRRIAASAAELVSADAAGVIVVEDTGPRLAAVHGLPEGLVGRIIDPGRRTVLDEVLAGGGPVVDPDLGHQVRGPDGRVLRSVAAVPTVVRGEISGTLYVLWEEPGRNATAAELEILSLLAGHAGVALDNASAFERLLAGKEREAAVIAAIADGLAVTAADGTVLSWNPAAAAITDMAADDVVGRTLPFPRGEPGETVDHQLPSGRWIEAVASPIPGTTDQVVDFRDVTEPRALEEAKNLFVAMTGHELKTPLTVISGFAATLLHRWDELDEDRRREALEAIVRRSESLGALIDQLLLVSRAEAGNLRISAAPVDLVPVLKLAGAGYDALSERHRLDLDVPPSLPKVVADAGAVETVIGQLLENAFKYSPDGGTVRITAEPVGDAVAVRVSDEGIGIKDGDRDRIFDRFYQSDGSATRRFGGVGLGLYIVRRLVEAQGGEVTAAPREPQGSTFTFTLPCASWV